MPKIQVENKAEAEKYIQDMYKDLLATMGADKAYKAVEKVCHTREFVSATGSKIDVSLSLEDKPDEDEKEPKEDKAVSAAVEGLINSITKKVGSIPGAPTVEVKDDSERLISEKNWGYAHLGEFALDVMRANHPNLAMRHMNERLNLINKGLKVRDERRQKAAPATYASELVGADGGFMVPPDNRVEVWTAIRDTESILGECDLQPTTSNIVTLPADENAPWDNTTGIISYWLAQGAAITPSKPVLQTRQIQLHTVNALIPATEELQADAPRLNTMLMQKAPEKIGWQIDNAIFRGTGAGQPLGFMVANSRIVVARNATTSDFSGTDVANMVTRLLESPGGNPKFYMTRSLWAKTALLTYGTSLGYPVALEGGNIKNGIVPSLLGYPTQKSMHTAALASAGDMVLADLKKGYAAFYKTDDAVSSFAMSMHLYFDAGALAFRWRFRIGGEPYLRSVVTPPYDTSNTLSHFVMLSSTSQETFN